MSWDDEDAGWDAPAAGNAAVATDKWDGEDEDEDVGEDWDADPAEKKEEKKVAVAPVKKALTKRQIAKKKEEEERQAAMKSATLRKNEELDPEAAELERAKVMAAIAQSNLTLVADCFGGEGYEAPENGVFQNDQLDADNMDMKTDVTIKELEKMKVKTDEPLEDVILKSLDDYKKFGLRVAKLTSKAAKQKLVVEFTKVLLDEVTKKMKLDEANEIKKMLNVICSKKQKEEGNKKKKGASKKAQLSMKADDPFDDGAYDDNGMDDFL